MEGRFNAGFFALRAWGAYIWRGLYKEGLIFGILSSIPGLFSLQRMPPPLLFQAIVRVRAIVLLFLGLGLGLGLGLRLGLKC